MSFSGSSYLFWNLTSLLWSAWQLWRCKVSVLQMGKKCQSWSSFLLHLRKIAAKNPSLFFGEKLTVTINLILLKERNHWNISFGSSRERNSLKARNKDLTIEFVKICILGIAIYIIVSQLWRLWKSYFVYSSHWRFIMAENLNIRKKIMEAWDLHRWVYSGLLHHLLILLIFLT